MKRLLSFVLALAMILSSLTNVTVYANEKEGDFGSFIIRANKGRNIT